MEYNLKLNEQDVNKILEVLSKRPYEEVFVIVDKIREQAINQENKVRAELEKEEEEFIKWKEEMKKNKR